MPEGYYRTRIEPTVAGLVQNTYYLSYLTLPHFLRVFFEPAESVSYLEALASCPEFRELPVRHEEDREMWELTSSLGLQHFADCKAAEDFMCTRAKALFLLVAQLRAGSRPVQMPNSDYTLDQHTVLENGVRFSAAAAELGMRLGCGLAQVVEIVRTVQGLV